MTTTDKTIGLLWVDIETTGLDEVRDLLLEISFFGTEYDGSGEYPGETLLVGVWGEKNAGLLGRTAFGDRNPRVREMHSRSGLWADLAAGAANPSGLEVTSVLTAIKGLNELISEMRGSFDEVRMAGSSVHFDQSFLRAQSQQRGLQTQSMCGLSHRTHDMTAMRTLYASLGYDLPESGGKNHRAEADIREDWEQWRTIYANLGGRV